MLPSLIESLATMNITAILGFSIDNLFWQKEKLIIFWLKLKSPPRLCIISSLRKFMVDLVRHIKEVLLFSTVVSWDYRDSSTRFSWCLENSMVAWQSSLWCFKCWPHNSSDQALSHQSGMGYMDPFTSFLLCFMLICRLRSKYSRTLCQVYFHMVHNLSSSLSNLHHYDRTASEHCSSSFWNPPQENSCYLFWSWGQTNFSLHMPYSQFYAFQSFVPPL